jgi:F0F1-type ATP synthase epsilon subunit
MDMDTTGGFLRVQGTEADVCADIAKRQALGINKYKTTVRDNNLTLREWLQHQYEELLDAAIYAKRAIEELDKGI